MLQPSHCRCSSLASLLFFVGSLFACGNASPPAPKKQNPCLYEAHCGNRAVFVADQLTFAAKLSDGTVPGFNLDGHESNGRDAAGCYKKDLVSPTGVTGVDNQFGVILSALPIQVSEVVPAAVQASINYGGLILLIEFTRPGSLTGHGESDVVFRFGKGTPLVGSDDRLLPHQTFALADDFLLGFSEGAGSQKGGLEGGPFDLDFRMQFLGTPVAFGLQKAQFRFQTESDGSLQATLGGAVSLSDLEKVVSLLNGDDVAIQKTLRAILPTFADVRNPETDHCDAISGTFAFHAIPAFILDPALAEPAP